jgi:hypothetical protein
MAPAAAELRPPLRPLQQAGQLHGVWWSGGQHQRILISC